MNSKMFMIYTAAEQVCQAIQFVTACSAYLLYTLPNKPIQGLTANCQFVIYIPYLKVTQNFCPLGLEKFRRVWVTSREPNLHRLTHHLHIWLSLLAWCQKMSTKNSRHCFDVTGHLPGAIFNNVSKTTKGHEESRIFSCQWVFKHS